MIPSRARPVGCPGEGASHEEETPRAHSAKQGPMARGRGKRTSVPERLPAGKRKRKPMAGLQKSDTEARTGTPPTSID